MSSNLELIGTGELNGILFSSTDVSGENATSFLRIRNVSNQDTGEGYNTDGTKEFETKRNGTRSIQLSDLPTLTIDEREYVEVRLRLNEGPNASTIDLNELRLYTSDVGNLSGYDPSTLQLAGLDPILDLDSNGDNTVRLDDSFSPAVDSGDALIYFPKEEFGEGDPYVYLYSKFKWANARFEEWSFGSQALGELADLSLDQTISSTSAAVGEDVTFTLTVANDGSADATGIQVEDLLPEGFEFVSATPDLGTYDPLTGIWDVGSLDSGETTDLDITATVVEEADPQAYTNIAEIVAANQFDPDSAVNNGDATEDDFASATVTVADPVELELTKEITQVESEVDTDGDGTPDRFIASPGDDVTFTITVDNTGTTDATDVVVFDDLSQVLPIGLEVVSLDTDGGSELDTDGNSRTLEVEFDSIAAGESKSITINARVSTESLVSVDIQGTLGSDAALPEYAGVSFDGTLYFHADLQKSAGDEIVNFKFLDFTNEAQVISIGGDSIDPTLFADSATLDISTLDIEGLLNNGEFLNLQSIGSPDSPDETYAFNPDPLYRASGRVRNSSQFLPPGQEGSFGLNVLWRKLDDPALDAALAEWKDMSSDGDLSDPTDELAALDALESFIADGVTRADLFESGDLNLDNGSESAGVGVDEIGLSPALEETVTVAINDSGATVNGQTFNNLQNALNSLNFSNPTGVNIEIEDSNGNGVVETRLRELGGFNFDRNWGIEEITIDGNVDEVIFTGGNNKTDLDFASQTIVANPGTEISIFGGRADAIAGTALDDFIFGGRGRDTLSGEAGDDELFGDRGKDVLIGGQGSDILSGGFGQDEFVIGFEFDSNAVDIITDFQRRETIDLTELGLDASDLDSSGNGFVDASDTHVSFAGGSLEIDLTDFLGGTLQLQGVSSVNVSAFAL